MFHFLQVAVALAFLEVRKYVHRDIAARNCLGKTLPIMAGRKLDSESSIFYNLLYAVGAGLRIKIADFGLARGVYDKDYYKIAGTALLPLRWMAPESILYGIFTTASDVW